MGVQIPLDSVFTIICAIVGGMFALGVAVAGAVVWGFTWISGKLDKIVDSVNRLQNECVTHAICKERMKDCTFGLNEKIKAMQEILEKLIIEKEHIIR